MTSRRNDKLIVRVPEPISFSSRSPYRFTIIVFQANRSDLVTSTLCLHCLVPQFRSICGINAPVVDTFVYIGTYMFACFHGHENLRVVHYLFSESFVPIKFRVFIHSITH